MRTNNNYYRALAIMDRIEEIREEKGIGKTIVGKTLGYSRQYYYSAYDNCRCLKVKTLDRIAKILDVSLEYLLTGKNKEPYKKIDINFDLIKNTKIKKLPNYLQSTRSYLRSGRCTDLNTKSLFEFEEYSKIPAIKLIGG
jgi:transcriptional regulator with XRE-family HTH domain